MDLNPLVEKLGVLSKNLKDANSIRERVRIADRVFDVLGDIERQVEGFVVNELGQAREPAPSRLPAGMVLKDRFRTMTIAEAGKILLKEHGQLHGKELERLLKEGGYRSNAENFQSTLIVAFKRSGEFQNIGGNTWRLKERAPERVPLEKNNGDHTNYNRHVVESTTPRPSDGAPLPEALRR